MKSAIVLVLDRFGAGYLGPYGNTWLETRNFNRFASESILLETMIADSPSLLLAYEAYLRGSHAAIAADRTPTLAQRLKSSAVESWLVTDEPKLSGATWEVDFDHAHHLPPADRFETARSLEETQLARYFAAVIDIFESEVASRQTPFLLWCHCQGMSGAWDAPFDYRDRFADEDDPVPPRVVQPPSHLATASESPDEMFGLTCAYAGQVALLDECVGAFFDAVSDRADQDTMIVLTSPRGYPLGEHRAVGAAATDLYTELVQVPCLVRLPNLSEAATRLQAIVQPRNVEASLRHWFELPEESSYAESLLNLARHVRRPDRIAVSVANDQCLIRSNAWLARFADCASAVVDGGELFLKPDDRWDANDIASRCPDVRDAFAEYMTNVNKLPTSETAWPAVTDLMRNRAD